ncbi:MAG: type II toxin-antitoxin system ParD family antitoxin [Pseudomonadota bacterium]
MNTSDSSIDNDDVPESIRKERDREHLRRLLLEGAESPLAGEADEAYFDELRELARGRAAK